MAGALSSPSFRSVAGTRIDAEYDVSQNDVNVIIIALHMCSCLLKKLLATSLRKLCYIQMIYLYSKEKLKIILLHNTNNKFFLNISTRVLYIGLDSIYFRNTKS